jgi:molybdopterin adenylyltransferase
MEPVPSGSRALVLTVSDGVAASTRQDESGIALADRLALIGFRVDRVAVADDRVLIEHALKNGATDHVLIVSTGGTGLTPRDVTPQATIGVIDYEVPGLAEAMRAAGRAKTPMADLSRGVVGVMGRSLVVNVPGSPRAALESLAALEPTLAHALETLAGPFDHDAKGAGAGARLDLPGPTINVGSASARDTRPFTTQTSPIDVPDADAPDRELLGDPPLPDANDEWRDLPDPERHGSEIRR